MAEENAAPEVGEKGFVPAILLCFFLGALGAHRFYVGKIGTGILMLLTLGGLGIWALIDFVNIASGTEVATRAGNDHNFYIVRMD